jgi:copper(I)-binding protein
MNQILSKRTIFFVIFLGVFCINIDVFASAETAGVETIPVLKVKGPYMRATNGKTGAIYLKIKNISQEDRKLLKVETPIAGKVELHKTIEEDTIVKMQPQEAIVLPANDVTDLAPGGLHIMLLDLKKPLKAGDKVDIVMYFDKGNPLPLSIPVKGARHKGCQCNR